MGDTALLEAVEKALQGAGIAGKVQVEKTPISGVVRLLGQVVSEDERLRADEAARGVEGVLDVIDEISITSRRR
jgi:osmotically-inducible protein OsmY